MKILFFLIPLVLSLFINYAQYQRNLDLKERLHETGDWIDPVALATLEESERADRLELLPVYTTRREIPDPARLTPPEPVLRRREASDRV